MGQEFHFPDVGEGITEGKLLKWLIKEGDQVKTDQSLAEVETDKAVVEIPSPHDGVIEKLLHEEGDMLEVDNAFIIFADGPGGSSTPENSAKKETTKSAKKEEAKPAEKKVTEEKTSTSSPKASQSSSTPSVDIKILPADRKYAAEKGIDLTTVTPTGPQGRITRSDIDGGKVGSAPVAKEKPAAIQTTKKVEPQQKEVKQTVVEGLLATPSVRQLARQLGVDIGSVPRGNDGRVTEDDVYAAAKGGIPKDASQAGKGTAATGSFSVHKAKQEEGDTPQPFSPLRKAIAKNMMKSLGLTSQVSISETVEVGDLVELRTKEKAKAAEQQIKLTYLPFFMKACINTLRKFPVFNAHHDGDDAIVLKAALNLGLAIDAPDGLRVGVVKDADKESIFSLAGKITDLASKAKEGKLSPADMSGSTFTITSIGGAGGEVFTPIINYPEVAILGIAAIKKKPVVHEQDGKDEIKVGHVVTLSLTFDHNVIDGAEATRFLASLKEYLQDPDLLLME